MRVAFVMSQIVLASTYCFAYIRNVSVEYMGGFAAIKAFSFSGHRRQHLSQRLPLASLPIRIDAGHCISHDAGSAINR